MQPDLVERARAGFRDYALQLRDRGDRSAMKFLAIPETKKAESPSSRRRLQSAELAWYRRKLVEWRKAGRLTGPPDFRLRVRVEPDPPWTLERVAAAAPESNEWDHLAALIILDGVVRRRFMDATKNIREVVAGIADEQITRALQDPTRGESIRAMVRDEVGAMFGELLGTIRRGGPQLPAPTASRAQRTCSRCGTLGHTAKTCQARGPVAPDKWACVHCTNLKGGPLSEPVTHPVSPKEFHKDDPSFVEAAA